MPPGAKQKLISPEQSEQSLKLWREFTSSQDRTILLLQGNVGDRKDTSHPELHSLFFLKTIFQRSTPPKETQSFNLPLGGRGVQAHTMTYQKYKVEEDACSLLTLPGNAEAVHSEIPVELFCQRRCRLSIRKVNACLNISALFFVNIPYKPHKAFCIVACICSF